MRQILLVICMAAGPVAAQSGDGVAYWPASKLKAYAGSLKGALGMEQLTNRGNYSAMVARREQDGEPEVHVNWADVHIPQDGYATILYGGKVEGGRETGPGEIRGGKIVGGKTQRIGPGDVILIPAGVPHQTMVDKGKTVTVLILKVEKK